MDQFCAKQNESYRRCVCSSKLAEIQSRERALGNAADQLQNFKDLNIDAITKTGAEVTAMLTETSGEAVAANAKDTSASAQQLAGISDVLNKTKKSSLSTAGTLDIAGDINAIWSTTDLAGGTNIANLTGESLYNAVHAQCVDLVASNCASQSILDMVVAAYGMYIENDCTALVTALDKKLVNANSTIRSTEREMNNARLENYNNHNSSSINDCIALVRADITANTACGTDYVHCLDTTGRYLNYDTGEPIYSANFFQLGSQISLSGDVLTNATNRHIVSELNRRRDFAAASLDTCRDLADDVWDEFMRQAIAEIYQGQQERIRTVKNECLAVVNACYDEQSKQLKDFSNIKDQLLIGSRLELSEELCSEKLNACSNLYGGSSDGMQLLLDAMHELTDQKIAKECRTALMEFTQDICRVTGNDTLHSYPYACRTYAPGEQRYAMISKCNSVLSVAASTNLYNSCYAFDISTSGTPSVTWKNDTYDTGEFCKNGTPCTYTINLSDEKDYFCQKKKVYTKCNEHYYLCGKQCRPCPAGYTCRGGTDAPFADDDNGTIASCGTSYPGSLYQKVVRYAMQVCVRPSESTADDYVLPTTVMEDVNVVMDSVRSDMSKSLAAECERLGGVWVAAPWKDTAGGGSGKHAITGDELFTEFYTETSANKEWGYCRK